MRSACSAVALRWPSSRRRLGRHVGVEANGRPVSSTATDRKALDSATTITTAEAEYTAIHDTVASIPHCPRPYNLTCLRAPHTGRGDHVAAVGVGADLGLCRCHASERDSPSSGQGNDHPSEHGRKRRRCRTASRCDQDATSTTGRGAPGRILSQMTLWLVQDVKLHFCRPFQASASFRLKRTTGLEPATFGLGSQVSFLLRLAKSSGGLVKRLSDSRQVGKRRPSDLVPGDSD